MFEPLKDFRDGQKELVPQARLPRTGYPGQVAALYTNHSPGRYRSSKLQITLTLISLSRSTGRGNQKLEAANVQPLDSRTTIDRRQRHRPFRTRQVVGIPWRGSLQRICAMSARWSFRLSPTPMPTPRCPSRLDQQLKVRELQLILHHIALQDRLGRELGVAKPGRDDAEHTAE